MRPSPWEVRLFVWLLRCVPATYTETETAGMCDTFVERARQVPSHLRWPYARFIVKEFSGLIRLIIAERFRVLPTDGIHRPGAWLQIGMAIRALRAAPMVTTIGIVVLSLGIGANTAVFSLFHQVLFRELPVADPGRLVNLSAPGSKPGTTSCNQGGPCSAVFSYPMFRDLERGQRVFSHLAAHRLLRVTVASKAHAVAGDALFVSDGYFPALGIGPAIGRLLAEGDNEEQGGASVVVLSDRYWRSHFAASPSVLNSTLIVNGEALTVVGVAPAGFSGTTLGGAPLVYVPMTLRRALQPTFREFADRR